MGGTHWASRVIFWHFVVQLWGEPLVYHINMWILIISPDWHQATQNQTKPLGQQNLQSPQLPRPSGHHSQSSWVANTSPSRRGAKEIQNLRLLAPYKNYPSGLGSYKMKFGGSPLPSTSHPARHRNPSTKKRKGFDPGSISLYNGVILLTFGPRFRF